MGPRGRAFYDRFESMIGACGEFHVAPALTRIAFLVRIRFATITRITEDHMDCTFALPAPLDSSRFARVKQIVPGWWVHHLRITDLDQLDAQVGDWLCLSYRLMGSQLHWKGSGGQGSSHSA